MKKLIALGALAIISLTGCGVYGQGTTVGYVYAVDDGFWNKVWFKTSLQASESDCYVVADGNVRDQLNQIIGGAKVRLTYSKHLNTVDTCPEKNRTSDEIINVELIDEVHHSQSNENQYDQR